MSLGKEQCQERRSKGLFLLCRYNSTIHHCFERKTKNSANMVNGLASNTEMDDNSNCDATVVLLKKGNCSSKSPCLLASF